MTTNRLRVHETEENVYEFRNERGDLVTTWYDEANVNYPEDLTRHRLIGDLIAEVYRKGYQDGKAAEYNAGYDAAVRKDSE